MPWRTRTSPEGWSNPGPPRYLISWEEGGEPELIAESGERVPITLGQPLPLAGGRRVEVLQLLADADFENNLTFLEPTISDDGWDEDFYARAPRGATAPLFFTRSRSILSFFRYASGPNLRSR